MPLLGSNRLSTKANSLDHFCLLGKPSACASVRITSQHGGFPVTIASETLCAN